MESEEKDKKDKKLKKRSKSKDKTREKDKKDRKDKKKSKTKENVKDGIRAPSPSPKKPSTPKKTSTPKKVSPPKKPKDKKKVHAVPPPPLEQASTPKKSKKKKAKEPPPVVKTSKGKLVLNKISVDPQPILETVQEKPGVAKIMGVWGENYCEDVYPVSPLRAAGGDENKRPKLRNIAGEKWEMDPDFEPPVFEKSEEEKKRIFQSFEDNFAFSDLTPTELEPMVDAFEKVEYGKGDVIAKEGSPDNFFYVVQEGKVSFDIDGEHICDGEVGDVFGEMSLVYSCDRATTVKSEDRRTALLRLDKTSYRHIRRNHVAQSVSTRMKLLKDVPFFKDADEQDLAQLSTAMVAHVFNAKDNLTDAFKDMPFCLIQEGSVTTAASGKMGPGGSFGEDNLQGGAHVASSVTAVTDGIAYTIDRPSFEKVFGDMNQLAQKSHDKKIMRDLRAIRAAKVDGPELDLLARQISEQPFLEGEQFCVMNEDMVPKLYIVREGSVKIVRKNGKEEIIKPGGFFGHEYLMMTSKGGRDTAASHVKAKYDATALEDGVCGILTLQECVSVFGRDTRNPEELEEGQIIPLEDLDHYRILGEGHFGTVWLVANRKAVKPEPYALKIQMLDDDERDAQECIKEEITVMRKLQYPSIVRVINIYEAEQTISMLLGLAPGGELFDQIHYQLPNGLWDSGIGEEKGRFYTTVIADTLAFMHIRGFIYRDLKPENVLIDKDGYPMITDFGFTRQLKKDELAYTMCGTPNYLPPEIIKNLGHGPPADNWSLAVLIYEVVQGESPFWYEGLDQVSLFHAICEEDYYPLPDEGVSEEFRDLIHRLLEKNPSKRLGTFKEKDILNHPWFTKLDIRKVRKKEIKSPWVPKPVELGEPVDPNEQ
jgi:CRP-like cAMP-binding protein